MHKFGEPMEKSQTCDVDTSVIPHAFFVISLRGFDAAENSLLGEWEEGSKEEVQRQPKDVRQRNAWKTHGEA